MVIRTFLYSLLVFVSSLAVAGVNEPSFNLGHYSNFSSIGKSLCLKYEIKENPVVTKRISLKKIFTVYDGVKCLNQEIELPDYVTENSALLFIGLLNQLNISLNNIVNGNNIVFSDEAKSYCKRASCPKSIKSFVDIDYFNGKGKVPDEFSIFFRESDELNQMIILFSGQKILEIKSFTISE